MTVIVILALVALFIGLRLYSVLGERTGHEQQPILKPAEQERHVEHRVTQPATIRQAAEIPSDLAYVPLAGPGVWAILAATRALTWRGSSTARIRLPLTFRGVLERRRCRAQSARRSTCL